jgi:hypothetical protein
LGWAAFSIYLVSFYLSEGVFLATSFDRWSDVGIVLRSAGEVFVAGLLTAALALVLPLLLAGLVAAYRFQGGAVAWRWGLLLAAGYYLVAEIRYPNTSRSRFAATSGLVLPAGHRDYLAFHPMGSTRGSQLAGLRDFYSFELPAGEYETFLQGHEASILHKLFLQTDRNALRGLPPEFQPNPFAEDATVYRTPRYTFIVTRPGSSKILIVAYKPPR